MKIALLYSLLIYQMLQHCDATGFCRSLSEVRVASFGDLSATTREYPGSNKDIYSRTDHCYDPTNNSYVLLHQNHHTGELDVVSKQQYHKFTIRNIQLNTSGIYCTYKQCAPQDREQCCIRIIVTPPEVEIILPGLAHNNIQERGVCFAKTWPLLTTHDLDVHTNGRCTITKFPLSISDTYTTAIFFTLDSINGSCIITCLMQLNPQKKNITINPTTSMSTSTSTNHHSPSPTNVSSLPTTSTTIPCFIPTTTPVFNTTPECTCSGVLGLYRITLWIIVLTLTVLSTAMISGFL